MAFKFNPTTGKLDTVNNKAEQITIADAGAYYTGTEVESALQEIGASLAATIWQRTGTTISPLNTGDTLSVDTIIEEVAGNGVTIDSVLLKDGGATLTDDLIIDTDLFFVDVSAQTINVNNSTSIDQILDEDSMVTDSAMALATQQSIKAYVDNSTGAYLPLAGGVMTGDITLAESVTSVKTGE